MIFVDFSRAIAQLPDARFRRVLLMGIGLTIALFLAIYAGILWLIGETTEGGFTLPIIGEVTWVGDLLGWGSLGLMLILSVILMIPVASAITSLFLEDVADAVEAEYYPSLPPAPRTSFWDGLRDTVNFFGVLVGANLLAFFAYVIFPFAAIFIFYALNGFLLGREYFQIAAMRREGRARAREMQRANRAEIWFAGILMAVPLTVPIMNLFIPILGAATFTHLYHRIAAR